MNRQWPDPMVRYAVRRYHPVLSNPWYFKAVKRRAMCRALEDDTGRLFKPGCVRMLFYRV